MAGKWTTEQKSQYQDAAYAFSKRAEANQAWYEEETKKLRIEFTRKCLENDAQFKANLAEVGITDIGI